MQEFHMTLLTDKVNIRWFKVLSQLERERTVSTKALAKSVSSTSRTIISDIANIRNYFGEAIKIEVTNIGYIFYERDSADYLRLKKELVDVEPLFVIITAIFNHEQLSIGEWADRLHKSESTILRNIRKLEKVIQDYEFQLAYSPVDFKGKEQNIRKFFLAFFYEADLTPHTVTPNVMIQEIVLAFSKEYQLETHLAIQFSMFCYILLISLERFQRGHSIKIPTDLRRQLLKHDENFDLMRLKDIILEKTEVSFSEEELLYIKLFLITNRNIDSIQSEAEFSQRYSTALVREIATDYRQVNPQLKGPEVAALITSFFTCCYLETQLSPLHIKSISERSLFSDSGQAGKLTQNLKFFQQNKAAQRLFPPSITSDLAINLTLFMTAIETTYNTAPQKIVFLLEGNHYVCLQIKAYALQLLSGTHELYFLDSITLNEQKLEAIGVDLIVTNYSEYINDYVLQSDYLLFQTIPLADDWQSLLKCLSPVLVDHQVS